MTTRQSGGDLADQVRPGLLIERVEHPVLSVIHERRRSGSKPKSRSDPHRVGLAVEGGGMRGIVSASMLAALEDFGFADCFDAVYGTSAGAISGAYFLARDTWKSLPLYYRDLPAKGLIDPKRILTGRSILDLDLLFDSIMETVRPLDYDLILNGSVPLGVVISMVDSMSPLLVVDFKSKADLKSALRATSWRPVLVRGTATYRGERAVDGSMLVGLPYTAAVDDGCTHVLSLSTFPTGSYSASPSLLQWLSVRQLESAKKGLGKLYLELAEQKRENLIWLAEQRRNPGAKAPFVYDVAPESDQGVISRWEMRMAPLLEAVEASYRQVFTTFFDIDGPPFRVVPRWTITAG